ncbi:MAG: spore coat protein [Gammaproteobacteria bacterium]|nr:spore coat protein [Gammaproteobacteria bacterium]
MDIKYKSLLLASCFIFTKAYAGTASSNLQVTATVTANCTIQTSPLAFGNYDPTSGTPTFGQGSIIVTCTSGTKGPTIGMNNGNNYDATQSSRTMSHTDGTGKYQLRYSLLQPIGNAPETATCTAATTAWGDTAGASRYTITDAPSVDSRTYPVCGIIPTKQNVPAFSNYTDSVTATIYF